MAQPVRDKAAQGPLLCGSRRGGRLTHVGMRANALSARVRALGAQVAVNGHYPLATLSPHDCRHYWATMAFRAGADIKAVQDAGGRSSAAIPMLYALAAEIANEGIVLPQLSQARLQMSAGVCGCAASSGQQVTRSLALPTLPCGGGSTVDVWPGITSAPHWARTVLECPRGAAIRPAAE